jgi:hypothetical protein
MSEPNKISISPLQGENVLLINGFKILIGASDDDVVFSVYRKGILVHSPDTLQQAIHWCED